MTRSRGLRTQSFQEAFRSAYGRHFFAGVGNLFIVVPLACYAFVVLSAVTFLIDIHRSGPILPSLRRALGVARASLWPILIFVATLGTAAVALDYCFCVMGISDNPPPQIIVLFPGIPLAGLILAAWTRRAMDAAAPQDVEIDLPPLCEGCGYNLTHTPSHGLCPECGLSVESSLMPFETRPGSAWESRGGARAALVDVLQIAFSPRLFYRSLCLRTPVNAARRFSFWQFFWMGVGAAIWIFLIVLKLGRKQLLFDKVFFPIMTGSVVAFVAWGLHRLAAAAVMVDWLRKKSLPDFAWARKIFSYEAAFLWIFCLFNGLFLTSILLTNGRWLSELIEPWLGHRLYILGLPPEPVALLMGNGFLCALWIWRYYVALAAIRWSNF